MFFCLEIDTDDIQIWGEIDSSLAKNYGLVPVVWGQANGKVSPSKLPSNLYFISTTEKAKPLNIMIQEMIKEIWKGSFRLISIEETNWSVNNITGDVMPTRIPMAEPELEGRQS